jgi:hypothetical protein
MDWLKVGNEALKKIHEVLNVDEVEGGFWKKQEKE